MKICIDPGHGMGNRTPGKFDSGAEAAGITEAEIVMKWANCLREILKRLGHEVVRTRVDAKDPAPVGSRAGIAQKYGCEIMVSLHCNAANGNAAGTETFYRGDGNKAKASEINSALVAALGTKDRGVKTEASSQHARLAVMAFPQCYLVEIGFIDNLGDRRLMTDDAVMRKGCEALAKAITS